MSLFRHPHLVRGIVHTRNGAFAIHRGIANLPDDLGDALGWLRVSEDRQAAARSASERPSAPLQQEEESGGA